MLERERLFAWDRAVEFVRAYDRFRAQGEYFDAVLLGLDSSKVLLLTKHGYLESENERIRPSDDAFMAEFADSTLDEITILIGAVGSPERCLERIDRIRETDIRVRESLPMLASEGWVRNDQDGYVVTDRGARHLEYVIVNYVMGGGAIPPLVRE